MRSTSHGDLHHVAVLDQTTSVVREDVPRRLVVDVEESFFKGLKELVLAHQFPAVDFFEYDLCLSGEN